MQNKILDKIEGEKNEKQRTHWNQMPDYQKRNMV